MTTQSVCDLCHKPGWHTPRDREFTDYGDGLYLWTAKGRRGDLFSSHGKCLEAAGYEYDGAPDGAGWTKS